MKWLSTAITAALATSGAFTTSCDALPRSGASLLPTSTPLLSDFREFCVDTLADPAAVEKVASRTGAQLRDAGGTVNFNESFKMKSWTHFVGGHEIEIGAMTQQSLRSKSYRAKTAQGFCTAVDRKDAGASVDGLQQWLGQRGKPAEDTPVIVMIALYDGRTEVIIDSSRVKYEEAVGHAYVLSFDSSKGATNVSLMQAKAH